MYSVGIAICMVVRELLEARQKIPESNYALDWALWYRLVGASSSQKWSSRHSTIIQTLLVLFVNCHPYSTKENKYNSQLFLTSNDVRQYALLELFPYHFKSIAA